MLKYKKAFVEITNICNYKCRFCGQTGRPHKFMSTAEFEHIASQVKLNTEYIYLHILGEPLLHPHFDKILDICALHGLKVNLVTNGTLITKFTDIAVRIRKVSFSLHAFEDNYCRINPCTCVNGKVEKDIAAYLDPILNFAKAGGCITELRLWNGQQALFNDFIIRYIADFFSAEGLFGSYTKNSLSMKLDENIYLTKAQKFSWPDAEKSEGGGERRFCYGLRDQYGVLCDGAVVPCCLDCGGAAVLGNCLFEPLSEILEGERATRIYEGFSLGKAVEPLCRNCTFYR